MRLVRFTALLCALVWAAPADANDIPQQQGETIALGNDGPFDQPTFEVMRSLTELRDAFAGSPPREDIDFSKGPLVLYAAPGGPAPLITGVSPLGGRTNVRVMAIQGALVNDRTTGSGRGARYHLIQVPTPQISTFTASTSMAPAEVDVVISADGTHLRKVDMALDPGQLPVLELGREGDLVTIAPANDDSKRTQVPSAWITELRGVSNAPSNGRMLTIPTGERVVFPGSLRYHPTNASWMAELAARPTLRGRVMRIRGAVYQPSGPRVDAAVDVQTVDPLTGRGPIPYGPPLDEFVTDVLDHVFPLKAVEEQGLAGGPVLANGDPTGGEQTTAGEQTLADVDEDAALAAGETEQQTGEAQTDGEQAMAAADEEEAEDEAEETGEVASADTPQSGMVGAVGDVAEEIEEATDGEPVVVTDGTPDGTTGEDLTKIDPEDAPDGVEGDPLTKPEEGELASTADDEEEGETSHDGCTVADQPLGEGEIAAVDSGTMTTVEDGPEGAEGDTLAATDEAEEQGEELASTADGQDQEREPVAQDQENEQDQEREPVSYPYTARVTASELNVREAANHDAKGLVVFFQNHEVEVVGQADNGWLVVKVPQLEGYLAKDVLAFPNGKGKKGGPASVERSYVNLRSAPGAEAAVSVLLRKDFPLTVRRSGHQGNWLNVTSSGEFEAFVNGRYLEKVE